MTLHVFANFVTPFGTAANNRGETEGNTTTLQKLFWRGDTHSTVSAEAIRFALRRLLGAAEETNRTWDEDGRRNTWRDGAFSGWALESKGKVYIDDDLLGFMSAEAAKDEAEADEPIEVPAGKGAKSKGAERKKGKATVRRAVLEVTRAVSLTPWVGDTSFNAASPGATPSASASDKEGKRDKNPVPYGTELHATRYQYGIALTPARLRDSDRAGKAIDALSRLGTVAGNHGRFLFDFSPDSVVFRLTDDPAPRFLYCFDTSDDGRTVDAQLLMERAEAGDIDPKELILGGPFALSATGQKLKAMGAFVGDRPGVRAAAAEAVRQINEKLTKEE
jgi:CRISPR-associated protein Cst2